MSDIIKKDNFYFQIKTILQTARDRVYKKVNFVMVEAYWNIGKQIVQEEEESKESANYGSYLIKNLSEQLTQDFGKGFMDEADNLTVDLFLLPNVSKN